MTVQEHLDHAREAERLGKLVQGEAERAAYERIAAVWRGLAEAQSAEAPVPRTG